MKNVSTWALAARIIALSFVFSLLALLPLLVNADPDPVFMNTPSRLAGFVKVEGDRELYVDYLRPAAGQPTVVLLNGLTYRLGCFDAFVAQLQNHGFGILRYDPVGMGQTLLKYAPITGVIDYRDQVEDLHRLLDVLNLQAPVNVIGLSYGGGLGLAFAGKYPERVNNLISMSPYTEPLAAQDAYIKNEITQTRLMFPLNPATDDQLYAYFFHQIVYTTDPYLEPIVLENPYKLEAVFQLGMGARDFNAKNVVNNLPDGKFHLMVALQDQYIPQSTLEAFWQEVPKAKRASRLFIDGSEHKIPEAVPAFAAAWVLRILAGEADLYTGATFSGNAAENTIQLSPARDQN